MKKPNKAKPGDEFYETMPLAQPHNVYRDDTREYAPLTTPEAQRSTAIITLILVGVVVVALALLFTRGLELIGSTAPIDTTSSGSLEP